MSLSRVRPEYRVSILSSRFESWLRWDFFSLLLRVCEQFWDLTHLVLSSGFHKCSWRWCPDLSATKNVSFQGFEPRGDPGRVLPNEAEAIWLSIPRQIGLLRKIIYGLEIWIKGTRFESSHSSTWAWVMRVLSTLSWNDYRMHEMN